MSLKRVWMPSPNYSSRGGSKVRLIVVHTAEGSSSIEGLGNFFASSSSAVSSHAGADDSPGTIGEYVKPPNKAWTQADANPYSVAIELCAFAAWTPADWNRHPTMLENCGRWIAEEAARFGIPIRRLSASEAQGGQAGVCGHNELGAAGGGHWDPGPAFPWEDVIAIAKGGATPAPAPVNDELGLPLAWLADLDPKGAPVPPEYLLHADSKEWDHWYAVYPSGLVRQVGDEERTLLDSLGLDLKVKTVKNENAGSRLYDYDRALQGELKKR